VLEAYDLVTPATLPDALALLASDPSAHPFAGGTDLMVLLEAGQLPPARYVSLWHCRELRGIAETTAGVSVGALTTFTEIRHASALVRDYPLLPIAAAETGGVATQNRGTIGGNIANASPAADTPPALLVYDAELELYSSAGTRRLPYAAFHLGYKKMDLRQGEIIARVHLPRQRTSEQQEWRDYYRKVGTRRAQAISKVCLAGSVLLEGLLVRDIRIALGGVAPTVVRAGRTEQTLRGSRLDHDRLEQAAAALASDISPIDDIRSTAAYRASVASNLLRDFLLPI
jgi:CO/xanthine dehydrogenase FAD-binding subunit